MKLKLNLNLLQHIWIKANTSGSKKKSDGSHTAKGCHEIAIGVP